METIRDYEIAYVIDAELGPEGVAGLKERIAELAKAQGAEVGQITQWDRRRLAYPLKGKREGVYIFMPLKAKAVAVDEVVRQLRLTEGVLRHLVIKEEKPKA